MIDSYAGPLGREAMVRFGPADAPVLIVALPPFEEHNRTRTFAVGLLRRLAVLGLASALPDLPGTNESPIATEDVRLADWRAAYADAAAAVGAFASLAIRAGALVDRDVSRRWHFAPQDGTALVRELERIRAAGGAHASGNATATIAGTAISSALIDDLRSAIPAAARIVRLSDDPREADLKIAGAPLWRGAEPRDDPVLAQRLAADILEWVRACGG